MGVSRTPAEIISREAIDELWGEGYTVVPRTNNNRDRFDIPTELIPPGFAYQWNAKTIFGSPAEHWAPDGWTPVPAERHPGWFAPIGYRGIIEFGGAVLMERPLGDVRAFHKENARIARQMANETEDAWAKRSGVKFFGHTKVGHDESSATVRQIGEGFAATKPPSDVAPYILEVFNERDRIMQAESPPQDMTDEAWRAHVTERAIENVRAEIAKQKDPVT